MKTCAWRGASRNERPASDHLVGEASSSPCSTWLLCANLRENPSSQAMFSEKKSNFLVLIAVSAVCRSNSIYYRSTTEIRQGPVVIQQIGNEQNSHRLPGGVTWVRVPSAKWQIKTLGFLRGLRKRCTRIPNNQWSECWLLRENRIRSGVLLTV